MSERWKIGNYDFVINPNRYGEQFEVIGDTVKTLDGTLITQPTSTQESYQVSSVFFQNRPRIVSEMSIGQGHAIEFANNKCYILDSTTKTVKVYSVNLSTLEKTINIFADPTGKSATVFDVQSDETVWAVQPQTPNSIIHKTKGTTRTSTTTNGIVGDIVGIKYANLALWVATSASKLYKLNPSNLQVLDYLDLPTMPYNKLGFQGMTSVDDFLLLSYNGADSTGVYYVDPTNGNIVNNFQLPDNREIKDVGFNGKHFVFLVNNTSTIIYTTGNTVLLDLYVLEKEIKGRGFLNMVDDMGVTNRVAVSSYSFDREHGSLSKYRVNISANKVDRGVN